MSEGGGLDLRYPIGGLFLVLGLILAAYGVATDANTGMYVRATSVNINLWWGVVMLAFGAFMWGMAMRAGRRDARVGTGNGAGAGHS